MLRAAAGGENDGQGVQDYLYRNYLAHDDPNGKMALMNGNDTIFAVNSDFQFLYMIGKWCNESGHNLFQGLLALNDYYLFCWHFGQRNMEKESNKKPGAALTT